MTPEELATRAVGRLYCKWPALSHAHADAGCEACDLKARVRIVLDAAIAATWLEAETAVREACGPCGGAGYVETSRADHGCGGDEEMCAAGCPVEVQEQVECEYCGRPIAAIRAKAGKGAGE